MPEIGHLYAALLTPLSPDEQAVGYWSDWRRHRQWQARRSHYKRYGHDWPQVPLQY
ncbi:hypothetical protein [Frankia sp. CiP1_Cm_nod1]|uniref:hypothetical protein n=1 Tax=Frankia sp. CiP1_Cm_nod1 TaxID=2897160 RepID=UPI0020248DB2